MIYKLYRMAQKLRKPKVTPVTDIQVTDIQTPEVIIPVGGIAADGTIYENKVYPDGKDELLYKERRIDGNQESKKESN